MAGLPQIKNIITTLICESHKKHQNKMFSDNGGIDYKKFWRHVKTIHRDTHGIAPLKIENSFVYHSEGRDEVLNKQFQSVFTKENLSIMFPNTVVLTYHRCTMSQSQLWS